MHHVTEEKSAPIEAIDRENLLSISPTEFSGRTVVDWLRAQKSLSAAVAQPGLNVEQLGPLGLTYWMGTEEGRSWRGNASIGGKKLP